MSQELRRQFDAQHRRWIAQAQKDPEFGGVHFRRNLALARKVIQCYGSKEFLHLMEQTRMGSHPELIRFFWKVGQALPPAKAQPKSIGELFYPGFAP